MPLHIHPYLECVPRDFAPARDGGNEVQVRLGQRNNGGSAACLAGVLLGEAQASPAA